MTGAAEEQRKVKPDPAKPQIVNGSFEDTTKNADGDDEAVGWHYQRQLTLKSDGNVPDGKLYADFKNSDPGRGCHALQGFAVDGREVPTLELHYWVRGKDIHPSDPKEGLPRMVVTFYDERRATVGEESTGSFSGSFDWKSETGRIRVPLRAREAILRIGLLGATGELAFDNIELQVAASK
jgi:protein-L-isoaspartate(D-aspartate) O-methyltransferase